jgi:hypothetical protein
VDSKIIAPIKILAPGENQADGKMLVEQEKQAGCLVF